ncbi:protein TolQ [Candidatus Schneideria nysicola]|uniref:protein TolQ n=1 Tax=Candidatus Schneideria nysicola TaxID=1081631 RepID=UPI001CAA7AD4|nr:protein TolQ [Candidatus Schneideria nysicola]UAJ65083.1 protein TolQ [Candidatus Schneideria nysicola]
MNIFQIFITSSLLVKVVLLILLSFSLLSWTIIIQRLCLLRFAYIEVEKFKKKFRLSQNLISLYKSISPRQGEIIGLELIFFSGIKEFTKLNQLKNCNIQDIIEGMSRVMRICINKELNILDNHLIFLGIISYISPYIGLFGTVWGILNAILSLDESRQTTLHTIAPAISESLITTAIGLFAAIPAAIFFNYLNWKINKLEQVYTIFMEESVAILQSQILAMCKNDFTLTNEKKD